MFETEMPAKRQFHIVPTPETVVRLAIKTVTYLILAAALWFGGKYALERAGLWPWSHSEVAEAATPQSGQAAPSLVAQPVAAKVASAAQPEENIVETAAALQERLASSICQGYGLIFDGQGCTRPPPPARWSAEGIRERAAPVGDAMQAVGRMIDRTSHQDSAEWQPQMSLRKFLHEPGEPCRGGGHRDSAGLMCVFSDEDREELRRYRR